MEVTKLNSVEPPYARLVVSPDDPRGRTERALNRRFSIEIYHNARGQISDELIERLTIDGGIDDPLRLIEAIRPDSIEVRATLNESGQLTITIALLIADELLARLCNDANPVTLFALQVDLGELQNRIAMWRKTESLRT